MKDKLCLLGRNHPLAVRETTFAYLAKCWGLSSHVEIRQDSYLTEDAKNILIYIYMSLFYHILSKGISSITCAQPPTTAPYLCLQVK